MPDTTTPPPASLPPPVTPDGHHEAAGPADAPPAAGASRPAQASARVDRLPPYKVLLHNDQVNSMDDVVRAIRQITPLNRTRAQEVMMTAHTRGLALVLVTHRERAELYVEQFRSKRLRATIEPA